MKLKDVIIFQPPIGLKKGNEYPFVEMAAVDGISKNVIAPYKKLFDGSGGAKFDINDILFARIEPCLDNKKICKVSEKGFGSTEFFVLRANENILDQDYLFYFVKTNYVIQSAINSYVGASGRQRADLGFIKNLTISFPSISIQQKIASILSSYDELIENNKQRISLLEEMAEEIYKEWFVRLRFPGYENTKIVNGLPEGWEKLKLDDVLETVKRKPKISTDLYLSTGKYPIIDQGNDFIAGYTNDESFVQYKPLPLLVFGDHTRRVKFVNYPFASGADGTQLLSPKNKNLLPIYFYISVKNIDLSNFHYARHFKFLKQEYITIPDNKNLLKFNNLVNPFYQEIQILKDKNQLLQETRDLLLPRLISGKLSVEHLVEKEELMMVAEPKEVYIKK